MGETMLTRHPCHHGQGHATTAGTSTRRKRINTANRVSMAKSMSSSLIVCTSRYNSTFLLLLAVVLYSVMYSSSVAHAAADAPLCARRTQLAWIIAPRILHLLVPGARISHFSPAGSSYSGSASHAHSSAPAGSSLTFFACVLALSVRPSATRAHGERYLTPRSSQSRHSPCTASRLPVASPQG